MITVKAIIKDIDYSHGVIVAEKVMFLAEIGEEFERYIEARWTGIKDLELGKICEFLYSDKLGTYTLQN